LMISRTAALLHGGFERREGAAPVVVTGKPNQTAAVPPRRSWRCPV